MKITKRTREHAKKQGLHLLGTSVLLNDHEELGDIWLWERLAWLSPVVIFKVTKLGHLAKKTNYYLPTNDYKKVPVIIKTEEQLRETLIYIGEKTRSLDKLNRIVGQVLP